MNVLSKDQGYGFVIFIISIVVALVYLVAWFAPWIGLPGGWQWYSLAVGVPVLLFVLLFWKNVKVAYVLSECRMEELLCKVRILFVKLNSPEPRWSRR